MVLSKCQNFWIIYPNPGCQKLCSIPSYHMEVWYFSSNSYLRSHISNRPDYWLDHSYHHNLKTTTIRQVVRQSQSLSKSCKYVASIFLCCFQIRLRVQLIATVTTVLANNLPLLSYGVCLTLSPSMSEK